MIREDLGLNPPVNRQCMLIEALNPCTQYRTHWLQRTVEDD